MSVASLSIDPAGREIAGRAILITGAARTGTTMMGQLIQSLEDVEYIFEPPALFALMPLIDSIDAEHWRLLYETYLFEDALMEALAGRRLNFNTHDDSYICRAKSEAEVEDRLSKSHRRSELVDRAVRTSIAYKMPDMIPSVPRLTELFPDTATVIMVRRPDRVIASVLSKGWFSDKSLRDAPGVWPFRRHRGFAVPFWLPTGDTEAWLDADETERSALYYLYMYEPPRPASAIVVDYDAFIEEPTEAFARLVERLGRTLGPKTPKLLANVAPRTAPGVAEYDGISLALVERMEAAWHKWTKVSAA